MIALAIIGFVILCLLCALAMCKAAARPAPPNNGEPERLDKYLHRPFLSNEMKKPSVKKELN